MTNCIVEILESLIFICIGVFVLKSVITVTYKDSDEQNVKLAKLVRIMWEIVIVFEIFTIILQIINISRL